ncbi:MAG: NTP transferase domain-containing protein [Pseudomonadales bacterium]|nr:mannose-1-phosphate guanylyltransferase [Candidatus Woesebacteria bacterium]MCB9802159.1 NTP transferase domain-containing protein [Pseudomonadales bacterium]
MSTHGHVFAVILAGGGGTRLWPKSRTKTPKQFLKLVGQKTMMQLTADRIAKIVPPERIIVVTNQRYKEEVAAQLPEVPAENIIAEPEKKDTALAMLTGSLLAYSKDKDAVVMNAASDHIVEDEAEFIRVMHAACKAAEKRPELVTVGITPTHPSTAFGYIKVGDEIEKIGRHLSVFHVENFTEKPNEATARAFISTGRYFWNANMYVWGAHTLIDAFEQHMPEMWALAKPLIEKTGTSFHKALPAIYKVAESISIDYAISEKADNLVLMPGDFGWNDVGEWKVVYDLGTKDLYGNVVAADNGQTEVLAVNSRNNLIHASDRLVAVVGIEDMIIVDTDEIVMIAPKSRSQDVKKLVERLKEEDKKNYL